MLEGIDGTTSVKDLVVQGAELKLRIDDMKEKLKIINAALVKLAAFKRGSKTGHIVEAGIKVTVSLKENVKWSQDRLEQVKGIIPESFNMAFIPEYKPVSAKGLEAAMKENEEFAKAVEWAREVKAGSPYVTYERVEDDEVMNA